VPKASRCNNFWYSGWERYGNRVSRNHPQPVQRTTS